ncbi:MAG: hypothetical protein QHC90_23210 [Shinella sp.]|nr:hypothetical protein [Shinella sp.]
MSAFLSFVAADAAYVLTDGASYDATGVVREIGRKVRLARKAPVAIASRGDKRVGDLWAEHLCAFADVRGVDALVAALPAILGGIARDAEMRAAMSGQQATEVLMAGVAKDGPFHRVFRTVGDSAYVAETPDPLFYAGQLETDPTNFVPRPQPGESAEAWILRGGVAILEACRSQSGLLPSGEVGFFAIGGQIDLTTITTDFSRIETLKVWPEDVVGQKIVPTRRAAA